MYFTNLGGYNIDCKCWQEEGKEKSGELRIIAIPFVFFSMSAIGSTTLKQMVVEPPGGAEVTESLSAMDKFNISMDSYLIRFPYYHRTQ